MNKVFIMGRLGNDPELKYTPSGLAICSMSIATTEKYKEETRTQWHKVVVFGKLGELCNQFLKKGRQAWIEGQIQTRSWDDKEGHKRYVTEIIAKEVKFLDGFKEKESSTRESSGNKEQDEFESFMAENAEWAEGEIPF